MLFLEEDNQCGDLKLNKDFEKDVSEIRRVTFYGAIVNILMSAIKISVGIFSHSQALVADGIHSFSDLITDFAVYLGAKYWNAPPDKKHPYGHGRLESIINIGIGVLLFVVAVGIAWQSLTSIRNQHGAPGWDCFFVALICIAAKEILFRWTANKGKAIKSRALVANAWHHRSDALSSVPVAIAVVGAHMMPDLYYLDHIAAVIVSVMIMKAAWDIVLPSFKEILEYDAGQELEGKIKELGKKYPKINEIHAVRSRRVGSAVLIDFHMLVNPNMSVEKAHAISKELKTSLMQDDNEVADVIIHIEPYEPK